MTSAPTTRTRVLAHVRDAWCCPHEGCELEAHHCDYSDGGDVGLFRCGAGHEWELHKNAAGRFLVQWQERDDG